MKLEFTKNPHFQKWCLMAGLMVSLGFNLSWNPQMVSIARNQIHSLDLAETTTNLKPQNDPGLDVGLRKSVDMKKLTGDDKWQGITLELTHVRSDGKEVDYVLKSDTECKVCGSDSQKSDEVVDPSNKDSLIDLMFAIANKKKDGIAKMSEANKDSKGKSKSDRNKSALSDEDRARFNRCVLTGDLDCVYNELEATSETCSNAKDTTETDDKKVVKAINSCAKKFDAQFAMYQTLLRQCGVNSSKSTYMKTNQVDCDDVEDSLLNVMGIIPTQTSMKKALAFMEVIAPKEYNALRAQRPYDNPMAQFNYVLSSNTAKIQDAVADNNYVDPAAFAKTFYSDFDARRKEAMGNISQPLSITRQESILNNDNANGLENPPQLSLHVRTTNTVRGATQGSRPPPIVR